jgi:periplasmic protein TonB
LLEKTLLVTNKNKKVMSYLINNQQKLNDVIFANRNQTYGAYAIRSAYGNTIFKSISFMMLGFGSIILTAYYLSNRNNQGDKNEGVGQLMPDTAIYTVTPFKTLPPPEKETASKEKPAARTPEETPTTSTMVSETATVEAKGVLNDATVAAVTSTVGIDGGTGASSFSTVGTGDKPDTAIVAIAHLYEVDKGPEFEGGLAALYRFLSNHLQYPRPASDAGKEGTVHVKFVVDETGKVTRLSLLNTLGYGLDDEAIRVVSIIPKFKSPAIMKGKPVKSYFQLPIKFTQH